MALTTIQYMEINTIGIVLLSILLFFSGKTHILSDKEEHKYFQHMLIYNIVILFSDTFMTLIEGKEGILIYALQQCFAIIYFVFNLFFVYCWTKYVLCRFRPRYELTTKKQLVVLAPAMICLAGILTSPWTGYVYSIDHLNIYHRGPLIWLTLLTCLVYLMISSIIIIGSWTHPDRSRDIRDHLYLLFFPFPLVAGAIVQMTCYGLSIIWIMSAISMVILYGDIQAEQLTLDPLTELYNRRQTNAQLIFETQHLSNSSNLLLVAMIDIDHFKVINDQYGHVAGDQALRLVAAVLKEYYRKSDFIGRFGGDEFLLLAHVNSREEAEAIIERLQSAIAAQKPAFIAPLQITLSIGYALKSREDQVTADSLLNEADLKMYSAKRQ